MKIKEIQRHSSWIEMDWTNHTNLNHFQKFECYPLSLFIVQKIVIILQYFWTSFPLLKELSGQLKLYKITSAKYSYSADYFENSLLTKNIARIANAVQCHS